MPALNDNSPLIQAVKGRKKTDSSEELLQMILAQVTRMADSLSQDMQKDKNEIVTTQESHSPS